jgi:hypothetical protein
MRTVPGFRCTSSNAFNLIATGTVPGFRYTSGEAFYLIARTIPGFRFSSSGAFYLITTGDAPVRTLPTLPNSILWTLYPVSGSISHWSLLVLPLLIMIAPLHPVPRYQNLPPQRRRALLPGITAASTARCRSGKDQ